jgi:sulfate transport system ATP-binding protein
MSVVVERLTRRFTERGQAAVDAISFEAPGGAITSIIGSSGAGKTTVLRLIAGLDVPDAGTIRIGGVDCSKLPVQKRGVGLVFQSYALFQNMTVRDNVGFGLRVRRRPKAEVEARVGQLLELIQLQDLSARYPSQLSGGQRQRVAFARALAIDPAVLLLDEPFGALDSRVRAELREFLLRLHDETRVTTVLVTHDQAEALELSEHVVVMSEGRIAQAGSPAQIYDHPASVEVASLLGASVLRGSVRSGQAELGAIVMAAPGGSQEGEAVQACLRPGELRLATRPTSSSFVAGRIRRIRLVGSQVKVSLTLPDGGAVAVEVPRLEFERLDVGEGQEVFVDARSARLFVGDYVI